ncbi:hypothetical protein EV284_3488 [Streptomyces sp. BK022]|uniref:hypothetical protein n=1 Tax=Streptomyces sp. BK022 TaxID=2512123 RepID=UPI0010DD548C|nr:hypothetical protein [Streptomyces sp. BK022]RZU36005.1 hypothetical protein EV284_3488 [Streptomyces sp. BK022]
MTEQAEELKCLENRTGECSGAVKYRAPLSGTGRSFPRCDAHWAARLKKQKEIRNRYAPASDVPPRGFDPTFCGESWDEDRSIA